MLDLYNRYKTRLQVAYYEWYYFRLFRRVNKQKLAEKRAKIFLLNRWHEVGKIGYIKLLQDSRK